MCSFFFSVVVPLFYFASYSTEVRIHEVEAMQLAHPQVEEPKLGVVIRLDLSKAGLQINNGAKLNLKDEMAHKQAVAEIGELNELEGSTVEIKVDGEVPQQSVVDVLNMLVKLEITKVTFKDVE